MPHGNRRSAIHLPFTIANELLILGRRKDFSLADGVIDDGGSALAEALSGPGLDARIVAVGLLGLASLGEGR